MTLPTQTFAQFVSGMASSWAASTNQSPVFSSGDVLLALFQAVGLNDDFLQALIQQVNNLARVTTSSGQDVDSWMTQFGFTRLPATFADGQVVFTKLTAATTPVNIPAGVIVQTQDGTIQYQMVGDADEPTWNPGQNAYVLQPGQTSLTATAAAVVAGSGGNVVANTLVQLGSSIPGIDQVTNPSPITNGFDAEGDDAFRARFVQFLDTLHQATESSIRAAATGVQQGLLVALAENQTPNGTPLLGSFTTFVDDGSGNPPTSVINAVFQAVDVARAFSVQPFVAAPNIVSSVVSITIHPIVIDTSAGRSSPGGSITVNVQNAISAYASTLAAGDILYVSAVESAALGISGVISVKPGTLINGVNADLIPGQFQEIRVAALNVSVSIY